MWDLEMTSPVEFGDSEAAKLCMVLHDCKLFVEDSLQQTIRTERIKHGKFKGRDGNFVRLGPCFKPETVDGVLNSLKDCFPTEFTKPPFLNEPEKLRCDWVKSSGKPVNGWTSTIDTRQWFDRLSNRHSQWKKMRIYELLKLSTYPVLPFYGALTLGLLCCWNPCLNVFVTGQGFKTITLEDIAFLTGLSPIGMDLPTQVLIDGALDMENITPWKNKTNMSFRSIVDYYNPNKNKSLAAKISRKEEVLFINLAFSKLMMLPSCNVNKTFLKLAANIEAFGSDPERIGPLCLAPLFLGQVYRCLYRLRTQEKLSTAGGPIWLISMWGLFHFPRLVEQKDDKEVKAIFNKPTVLPVENFCCYGELAIHIKSPIVHLAFQEVLRGLLFPREASQIDWYPFYGKEEMDFSYKGKLRGDRLGNWMKAATPSWLLNMSCVMFEEGDQLYWSSILVARDLICLEPQVIGVEVYNPNLVARQFGLTQGLGIPYYKTLNRPWGSRPNLLDMALKSTENKYAFTETWLKSFPSYEVRSLHITPWFRRAAVDPGYELWWIQFLKRCQPSWLEAFATLVRNIQGPEMISSKSSIQASSKPGQNKQSSKVQNPVGCGQTKASSQIEKCAQTCPSKREQKRKSETITGTSTFRSLKKSAVEESQEYDDNTPLKIFRRRHSTQSCLSSLGTLRKRKFSVDQRVREHSQPGSGVLRDFHDTSTVLLSSLDKRRETNFQEKNTPGSLDKRKETNFQEKSTPQDIGPDIYNVSLNVLRVLEKEGAKEEATTPDFGHDIFHAAQGISDRLTKMVSEEAALETVGSEPEDSLEPPHEMVRGMGSSILKDTSSDPSIHPNYQPSVQVEPTECRITRAISSDISQPVIVNDFSASSEMLEYMDQPSSPREPSYTPEKALAEVNSLVYLIEDNLHPASIPSTFKVEKENAEKILNTLQSNAENLTAYAALADQIHRLAAVSPPQFQPNLAHFRTTFLSLKDQLQDICKHGDRVAYNSDTLRDLQTVAKDLRDHIQNIQIQINQIQAECSEYDKQIEELEEKLHNLKQLRSSKQQELTIEQAKFAEFSLTWSVTIPSLQKQANIMVSAQRMKAERESTLRTVKANVHSLLELLRTM